MTKKKKRGFPIYSTMSSAIVSKKSPNIRGIRIAFFSLSPRCSRISTRCVESLAQPIVTKVNEDNMSPFGMAWNHPFSLVLAIPYIPELQAVAGLVYFLNSWIQSSCCLHKLDSTKLTRDFSFFFYWGNGAWALWAVECRRRPQPIWLLWSSNLSGLTEREKRNKTSRSWVQLF